MVLVLEFVVNGVGETVECEIKRIIVHQIKEYSVVGCDAGMHE